MVGKPSRTAITANRRNKLITLPKTTDITLFAHGLKTRLSTAISDVQQHPSSQLRYRRLQEVAMVRAIQFNRRRGQVFVQQLTLF